MIPKIIHQTGPDSEKWHPIWKECQESWKEHFSDFEYVFWTDDDIHNLVKNQYPEFLEFYESFEHHIIRVDFARFCILHSQGGIYADLDIYCYKNFYSLLRKDLYIVESWSEWQEKVQNSLMISTKNNKFWMKCMRLSTRYLKQYDDYNDYILSSCGPRFISQILDPSVKFLPKEIFNPKVKNQFNWGNNNDIKYQNALHDFNILNQENDNMITRHYLTGNWS